MKNKIVKLFLVSMAAVCFAASTSVFSNQDVVSNGYSLCSANKINCTYVEKLGSDKSSIAVKEALAKLKMDFDAGKTVDFMAAWDVLISVSEPTNSSSIGVLRTRMHETVIHINSIKAKTDLGKERALSGKSGKMLIEEMKYFGLCDESNCSLELAKELIQNSETKIPSTYTSAETGKLA
jgi:hypothetical protein